MSRSFRKPYLKDKGYKDIYNRVVRSSNNQQIRDIKNLIDTETYEIKNKKEIIDDYTYSDFKFYMKNEVKYKRK